jgi:hypothetical protein
MIGKGIERNGLNGYNERSAQSAGICLDSGEHMIKLFMGNK